MASTLAWVVVAIALLVIAGWALDVEPLKQVVSGLPTMKLNTALALLALATAILLARPSRSPRSHRVAGLLAAAVAAFGLVVLVEYAFGDVGVDELLVDDPEGRTGRPSLQAATALVAAAGALLTLDRGAPRHLASTALQVLSASIVVAALVGYVYEVNFLRGRSGPGGIAIHTVLSLGLVTAAIAFLRPGQGVVGYLRRGDAGATLARRLLPAVIAVPVVLGVLRLEGRRLGLFDLEVGSSLITLATIAIFAALVVLVARRLSRADARVREAARHFEISHDLLCTATPEGYFSDLNGAWEATLGWSNEELRSRPFVEFVHPDDRAATEAEARRVGSGGEPLRFANRYLTKSGDCRWLEWIASFEDGVIYAAARDVTERRAAESRFRELLEATPDPIVITDSGGTIVLVNAQVERSLGYRREELVGQPVDVLVPDRFTGHGAERKGYMAEPVARPMGSGRELWARRRDGTEIPVEISLAPLETAEGTVVLAAVRDVSVRHEAERLKQDFVSLISHELRTPLTSILGYAELLSELERERLSERGRGFLDVIERNSRRELRLVGDLLLLTRIEAGSFQIEVGAVRLDEIAAAAIAAARPAAEKGGVALEAEIDAPTPIAGDAGRLGQVLDNLLSNAIKFSPEGGRARLRVTTAGERALIEVSDSGIGIPAGSIPRLFERMYRTEQAERLHIQGTGLGLPIVKAIVEAHGGTIEVESEPGEGSTFRVWLPTGEPPVEASEQRSASVSTQ